MKEMTIATDIRQTLRTQGFALLRSAIEPSLLDKSKAAAWRTVESYGDQLRQADGELPYCLPLPVKDHIPLLDHAEALLQGIGADPYYLTNLMLIMKRPQEGRRYWHTDAAPLYAPSPTDAPELFALYFLQRTTIENGCLLVVPGYAEGPQHSDRVVTPMEGEYPVETEPGDVIIMDPRLLHGSMPNDTDDYRFNIRLWIQCRWEDAC
jgi:hypothetical protein